MNSQLFRITINTDQPDNLVRFYSVIGFQFQSKNVEKGSLVWKGSIPGIELDIFGITESFTSRSPSVQFSFQVSDVNSIIEKIRPMGVQIMMEPLAISAGTVCFIMDPDGRSVELLQKS